VPFKKGEDAESFYILEQGTFNLVIKNGGSLIYGLTGPGQVFGWSSMVESGVYTASGVCGTDLKAVKIKREKIYKIFARHPEVGFKVLKRLAGVISHRLSNAYRDLLSARGHDTTLSYG
jgi:CRP-like cAMP-binding protein